MQRDLADRHDEQRLRPACFELEQPPRLGAEAYVDPEDDGPKQEARLPENQHDRSPVSYRHY